jgi:hypothetical protein
MMNSRSFYTAEVDLAKQIQLRLVAGAAALAVALHRLAELVLSGPKVEDADWERGRNEPGRQTGGAPEFVQRIADQPRL